MKKRFFIVLAIIVMVTTPLVGCTKQKAYQALCFEQGGLMGKEGKCILPTQQVEQQPTQPVQEQQVEQQPAQPVQEQQVEQLPGIVFNQTFVVGGESSTTPNEPNPEEEIPKMEWYSNLDSKSPEKTFTADEVSNHLEWWQKDMISGEGGIIRLSIAQFSEFSFNSVVGVVSILDKSGNTITILKNGNHYQGNRWFPVEASYDTIMIQYVEGNASNGCVIFAKR